MYKSGAFIVEIISPQVGKDIYLIMLQFGNILQNFTVSNDLYLLLFLIKASWKLKRLRKIWITFNKDNKKSK